MLCLRSLVKVGTQREWGAQCAEFESDLHHFADSGSESTKINKTKSVTSKIP